MVKDRVTKKSRGFGFITFSSEDGVTNALKKNGTVQVVFKADS